ncbi:GntR family transcriptional regulator [Actinocorallia aurea]
MVEIADRERVPVAGAETAMAPGEADRSLPQLVYERVRQQIISGELRPGQRLIERELSEALRVSRVPLRAALPQLEADGLIKILPRRGAIVTELSMRDAVELFEMWEVLEVMAARRAARNAAAGGGAPALAASIDRAQRAIEAGDAEAAARETNDFHRQLHALADHRLLGGVMQFLESRQLRLARLVGKQGGDELAEHRRIYEAVREGDEELAAALVFTHIAQLRRAAVAELAGSLPEDIEQD